MDTNDRIHAIISGRVQGVCYRMETQRAANKYGVKGWVRNKSDGTVEAVFEGSKEAVGNILKWCKQGPIGSRVDDVKAVQEDYKDEFLHFKITY